MKYPIPVKEAIAISVAAAYVIFGMHTKVFRKIVAGFKKFYFKIKE